MAVKQLCTSLCAGLVAAVFASPASADLIFNSTVTQQGTGLGNVATVVTAHDVGGTANGVESACVSATPGAPPGINFNCLLGLQGGDQQQGQTQLVAGTNADLLAAGLVSASQLALTVNLAEPGNDDVATLTALYLSVYDLQGNLLGTHAYAGGPLELQQTNGIGGAGSTFTLTLQEQLQIVQECPVVSQCIFGAGVEFGLPDSTDGGPETVFISVVGNSVVPHVPIPEPGTLTLLGAALGLAALRRQWRQR
jgi:PEP-CTERM motif